jgi:hypothetical protein
VRSAEGAHCALHAKDDMGLLSGVSHDLVG